MARLAIVGATGRMGSRALALASEQGHVVVAAIGRTGSPRLGSTLPGTSLSLEAPGAFGRDVDVVVDLSLPDGLSTTLTHLDGRPLVTGVTGLDAALEARLDEAASRGAVLHARNFSAGVHVLAALVGQATRALPDYDIEIVEAHHRHKVDAPSGTALLLAEAAASGRKEAPVLVHGRQGHTGERAPGTIGMHALRLGDVVGDHTVWLGGGGERLQLGHVATSRDTFVHGALRAASWLHLRAPGRYAMTDVLGL